MNAHDLPPINASLNFISAVFLALGYLAIRGGDRDRHRRWMIGALVTSILFLASYLIYHTQAGSVAYPLHDWTRSVYFTILVPHIILAALQAPFILLLLVYALRGRFELHAALARRIWPVWMFVSLSGVVVYLMLYQWAGAVAQLPIAALSAGAMRGTKNGSLQ